MNYGQLQCILFLTTSGTRQNPTKNEEDLKRVVNTLTSLGVTHLVTIGGDDTAYSSARVSEYAKSCGRTINVVHVPKTIDNDLPLPDGVPTFGFETARELATMEIENLIGLPIDIALQKLKENNLNYEIIDSGDIKGNFDTIVVVKVLKTDEKTVKLFTDRFLLNI